MRPVRLLVLSILLALTGPAVADQPRELSFIYLRSAESTTMSGDLADLERVKKAAKPGERLLWVRTRDGVELLVRDPATLARFEGIWKTANALAHQQGEIGGKQGQIGGKQGVLGGKQGVLGARQGLLASKLARLEIAAQNASSARRDALARKRRAIETEMRLLEQEMAELEQQMKKLEPPLRELERQMRVVAKQHEAASKRAHAETSALIARAIASGIAKPF